MTWLQYEHPRYSEVLPQWQLVRAFYTGENVTGYILQHKQGESKLAFDERKKLAHFHGFVGDIIDSLSGLLFEKEDEVVRDWGPLGSPEVAGTTAHRIWTDADGQGTNYSTLLRKLAIQVLIHQEMFVLVDAPEGAQEARIRLIPPTDVPNYLPDMTQIVVRESVDERRSLTEKPDPQTQFVVYTPEGWTRYRMTAGGQEVVIAEGAYSDTGRVFLNRHGEPVPPIFRLRLPFDRYVAHQLADSARVLLNTESDRDNLQRAASYPKLVISGDDDHFNGQVEGLRKGSNVLHRLEAFGDHNYIAPPVTGVEAATTVLAKKIKQFYDSAWRLYDAEGKIHQTATGAALDRSSGLASALAMIAATLEEFETQSLWLLAQAYSDRPEDWHKVRCVWPMNFVRVELTNPSEVRSNWILRHPCRN